MKSLIVLPSYNESENLPKLIDELLLLKNELEVLVVDDNSPDGTSQLIEKKIQDLALRGENRLHLIVRSKKDGRGGAVRRGLEWGLEKSGFDSFVEMDCDFSHHPSYIEQGLQMLKSYPVVLGSRYPDGEIIGWPLKRKLLSFFANFLARMLISPRVKDYTNGFRFYTRDAAQFICKFQQKHKGYIYLSETLAQLMHGRFSIGSFPIRFVNRERGVSNTTFSEVWKSLSAIFLIGWEYRFGKFE